MKKLVAVLAAMLLALTACGESGDAKTAKKNLSANVLEDNSGTASPFDKKSAECFSDRVVDDIGVEKLQDYGILDEDLKVASEGVENTKMSSGDAGEAADAIADCVDFDKFFAASFNATDTDPKAQECLKEAVTKEVFRDLMKATFEGDTEEVGKIAEPAQKCMMEALPSEIPTPTATPAPTETPSP